MCMLTFYRPGAQPDEAALLNGAEYNNDGHGFAIVAGNRLIIRKGLHFGPVFAAFAALRKLHADGPALFHSRMGTAGDMTERNCHPFRTTGDRRTVLAHNGVFPAEVQPTKDDPRSDTRIVAEEYAGGVDWDDPAEIAAWGTWMGAFNKVVILTVNPVYAQNAYIVNESRGHWEGDTWYSNYDYLDPSWRYRKYSATTLAGWAIDGAADEWAETDPNAVECPRCESSLDVEEEARLCVACHLCLDCLDTWDDCQCWTPGNRGTSGPYGAVESDPYGDDVDDARDDAAVGAAARADMAAEAVAHGLVDGELSLYGARL